jgi:VWFA-related protein
MLNNSFFLRGRFVVLNLLIVAALCLSPLAVQTQEKKEIEKVPQDDDVVKVSSNLVNLDVIVKDKKGKTINDLKAEDFTIYENGVAQKLAFFDSTLAEGNAASTSAVVSPQPKTRAFEGLPRNIISLVLDGQTTEGVNFKQLQDGITKYIQDRITENDSVALFAISGGLQLIQPFTQDKTKLFSAVERAYGSTTVSKAAEQQQLSGDIAARRDRLTTLGAGTIDTAAGGSAAAEAMITQHVLEQYIQLRSALSVQQTRPILAGLAAICEGLRPIPGKKTLVMFSQGFVAPEALDWQVQSTIDIANRANVAIYIIDSSGLRGGTPQSSALVPSSALSGISAATSQESRIRAGAGESVFDVSRQEGLNRQQDLLYRISGDTGGQFIKNTNDIASGLDRIDSEIRSRYTLSYRSTDPNFDGSFRKIKIEVRRAGANVVGRQGYYAIPAGQVIPFSPEDRKLLARFATIEANSTLPLSLELNHFRTKQGNYIVPVSIEIPPAAVTFGGKGDKQRLELEVLGVVRAAGDDKILSRIGGNFDVPLTAKQYESISNDKIFYRQDMQLETGRYTIDLLVKDRLSGKIGARRTNIELPAENSEFFATAAVLSRHAEPVRLQPGSTDVFAEGNVQIRPSPSREFRPTDNLIIFFKLYNAGVANDTRRPLVKVILTLNKEGSPVVKPIAYELSDSIAEPVPHLTFAKFVKLTGLQPGKYSALIEARDMVGQKVLKQEAWFVITQ